MNARTMAAPAMAFLALFASRGVSIGAEEALVTAARREGVVNWYTTQIVDQFARPAADAFERKYGIKVDFTRADPAPIVLRVAGESKAGRVRADVFDSSPVATALKKENLALKWTPDSAARLGARNVDAEGFWTATNLYVLTPAYNTELVRKDAAPRSWDDLLDPRWKGRMAWNAQIATAGAAGFVGLVLTELGEEKGLAFLRKLAAQNVAPLAATARQVVDLTMAGEYSIALQIFNNHPVISASKGAPVDWIAMSPAFEYPSVVGVVRGAPHENAAKLFVEFLISPEGQALYRDADYMPADPAIPARVAALRPDGERFRSIYFTPERIEAESPRWTRIFGELFR